MSKKTLLIQPIQGKFVQSTINGKIVRVWLVNPDTNEQGTEVAYNDAIMMLAYPHPIVCAAQIKGKDGKYVKILDEDDLAAIEQKKSDYANGVTSVESAPSTSNSALEKLVDTQSKLIESQAAQLSQMQNSFAKMQKTMEKLLKKSSKQTDSEEISEETSE